MQPDDAARLVDDVAQILAGPLLARAGDQHGLLEARDRSG